MKATKQRVFFIHVAISATLLLILLSVMLLWWYPKGLFGVAGGWDGLKILLPIDMVLGPTLTLLFYKPGKKSAVFDLSAIACVQALALGYGVVAVYSQHPSALVLAEGQLQTLTPNDHRAALAKLEQDQQQAIDPADLDGNLPPVVVAKPYSRDTYGQYLAALLNDGLELAHRAERYQGLQAGQSTLEKAKLDATEVQQLTGADADPDLAYLRLRSMYGKGVAVLDQDSHKLLRVLPISEPPASAALNNTSQ